MLNLEGKKVLLTGATGGIGSAIAEKFSSAGAVVGLSARNEDKLKEISSKLKNKNYIFEVDLSNLNELEGFIENADKEMDGIDVLICNAGITKDTLSMKMKTEDFQDVLNVNLTSTFILNRDMAKKMMRKKYGRIINICFHFYQLLFNNLFRNRLYFISIRE